MRRQHADDRPWVLAILKMKERLSEPLYWYPFPAMIGFTLVLILGGHLLTDLNPRLGARVDVIPFEAPRQRDGGIWLGVYQDGHHIHVVTSDRKKFSWDIDSNQAKDIDPLVKYLKVRVQKEIYGTAMKLEPNLTQSTAVIAVDQRLRYGHLRPVIYALAEARISRYGFETRIIHR
ncbi:MAG: hypothetical protein ACOH5I_05570 [Oligoflexus sp.]